MMEVSPVTRDAITAVWPDVEDYIRLIVDQTEGDYDLDDIFGYCRGGRMTMLVAHDGWDVYGVVLSEVLKYPQKVALNVFGIGGRDLDKWLDALINRMLEGKENIKADYLKAYVRPGLAKKIQKYGAKMRCCEMVMK